MAKVSVIVPVYNVRDYLSGAVESLLRQTERDLEIILVDDGSTDGSGALCDRFAKRDKRIKVLHKENGGLSSARNAGVGIAAGEYILFLDGDDCLLPSAVSRALEVAENNSCDFVQFLYREQRNGDLSEGEKQTGAAVLVQGTKACFEMLYQLGGAGASACTKLMRAGLAREIPFRRIRHEDEQWCTEAFQRELTAMYLPETLYVYVIRGNSIITGSFRREKLELFQVISNRIEVLKRLHLDDLLSREYQKLFGAILRLHCEARAAGDREAVSEIKALFEKQKKEIGRCSGVTGKYRLLFLSMRLFYGSVEFYSVYHNRKQDRG